jgi:uncharacterized protein (DUF58 family)
MMMDMNPDLSGDEQDETLRQRRPWYILALILFALSLLSRQPLVFLATLFTLLVAVIPNLWYRQAMRHLVVHQHVNPHHVFFGEEVILSLSIENRKLLPLPWLKVEDKIIPPLAILSRKATRLQKIRKDILVGTWMLWSFQKVTRHYRMQCQERGFHTFGPVELSSSDPFGWLTSEMTVVAGEALLVYPLLAPVEAFGLSSVHPLSESVIQRPLLEDPLRFAGVRDYVLGDDLRRIHWKATAHAGVLCSKIYEPPALRRLLILLDVWNYSEMLRGTDLEIQELTISAAASLAMWALDEGYMVGLLANCASITSSAGQLKSEQADTGPDQANGEPATSTTISRGVVPVPFASDHGQYERILSTLARLVPTHSSSLGAVIDWQDPMFPPGTTILLVSAAKTLRTSTVERLLDMRTRRGSSVHLALTGDVDKEVETFDLPVYYLGGKEKWHELIRTVGDEKSGMVGTSTASLQLD